MDRLEYYKRLAQETGKKYLREVSKLSGIIYKFREAEQSLQRYKTLVESSCDPIFMLDGRRRIISFNRAFCELFQYRAEEIRDRKLRIVTRNEDEYEKLQAAIEKAVRSNPSHTFEWQFVRKDSSPVSVEVTISSIVQDSLHGWNRQQPVGYVSILHDVSKRIEREAALRNAEEKYRNIFENAAEGIFQTNSQGRYVSANPALARIFGFSSPEGLLASPDSYERNSFVKPADYIRYKASLDGGGMVRGFESERYRKDGTTIWTSVNARVVEDRYGNFLYYEGTIEDVTQSKSLESQLRQAQKMEAIGTLAGGIAHDFNNILAVIMGNTDLALDDVTPNTEVYENLRQIMTASERARDLIRQILTFSRKSEKERISLHLLPLLAETAKLLRASLPTTVGIELTTTVSDDMVVANASQIELVLMNLATNAVQAMPNGGNLKILVSEQRCEPKDGQSHEGDIGFVDYIRIDVTDTGCGMNEYVQRHIFEPFFTTKEPGKGTGLGLAVVYGVVKNHHGEIKVRSAPGQGTTFTILLPKAGSAIEQEEKSEPTVPGGRERILFLDDEEAIRKMAKQMLVKLGYTVETAGDPNEALRLVGENPAAFDLVITDQTMPGMTGLALSKHILALRQDMPIILCTGYSEVIEEMKGQEDSTVRHILSKPIVKKELAGSVRAVLDSIHKTS